VHDSKPVVKPRTDVLGVDEVRVEEARARLPTDRAVGDVEAAGAKLAPECGEELIGAAVWRGSEAMHDRQVGLAKERSHSDRRKSP
jgi:hypothetical protein